jgi:hypothetical protein
VQYIDDAWLHLINGSNWAKAGNKDDFLKQIFLSLTSRK